MLIALITATLILQAQMIMMLQDMQTYFLRSFTPTNIEAVMDSNPLPPVKTLLPQDYVKDSNPLPPVREF